MLRVFPFFILVILSRATLSYSLLTQGHFQSPEEPSDPSCLILNLESALSRALHFNRSLLNTYGEVTSAQYDIALAENEFQIHLTPNSRIGYVGGGRDTGLSAGGGIDISKKWETGTQLTLSPNLFKINDHYRTEIRALFSQPLLRGLGKEYQLSSLRGAQFGLRFAYRHLYMAQVQLILRTVQALYEIVKGEKALSLHQESYERIQKFYQAACLKEKLGLSDSLDIYRAEMEMRHAEESLNFAQERLQEAEDLLRDLLALPLDQPIQIELPLACTPSSFKLNEAIQMALQNRIEMDQSEDQLRENQRLSRLAKDNLYPELNLILNYSNCGEDQFFTRACTRRRDSTWGVGLTTSADFSPLGEQVAYQQSQLAVEGAQRGIDQTRATIILEVKKGARHLDKTRQRMFLQEEQIKIAQGELQLAKLKFDRSLADNFYVIQAEKALRTAQQAYWGALIDHLVGEFQLLAALGLLIDKPELF